MAAIGAGMLAAGLAEARAHRRALAAVPLRIHVNGTRGKSSVTEAVTALFRALGKTAVGKTTGTVPIIVEPDGSRRRLRRRGRTRIQEQARFLRHAAATGADVAVVECMAVAPALQWICEHRLVRSHIGIITNVRRDHVEEMGRTLEEIARCLANTIPRRGILVTADRRFAPLFEEIAAPLGTRVVLVGDDEVQRAADFLRQRGRDRGGERGRRARDAGGGPGVVARLDDALWRMHAENVALACRVAMLAGFSEAAVQEAARALSVPRLRVTELSERMGSRAGGGRHRSSETYRCLFVHAWSMNDTDSFGRLLAAARGCRTVVTALYNHRSDRPLRALEFGRLFASEPGIETVLVTGDGGGARLLRRAGVPAEHIHALRRPLTGDAVADAVAKAAPVAAATVVVLGCGNARGVAELELAGEPPAEAGGWDRA